MTLLPVPAIAAGDADVALPADTDVEWDAPGTDAVADLPLAVLGPDAAAAPAEDRAAGVESLESAAEAEAPDRDPVLEPDELLALARHDRLALGPLSLGTPDAGLLLNPVPMPDGGLWTIRNPEESYGTRETIDFLASAITAVETRYPGSPRLVVGDISRPDGGRLNRHRSHQAGRDADLGFYYARGESGDFQVARKGELDLPRTWALVRALLTETDVDRIFVDRSIQRVLYSYALASGEDQGWLDDVFGRTGDPARKGIIQHVKRHKNHFHVRFYNRIAQERARVVHETLVDEGAVPPPMVKHRVRRGETLGAIAARYGTSAAAIRAANGLRSSRLRAGRGYLVPIRRVPVDDGPLVIPPRRLPPSVRSAQGAGVAGGAVSEPVVAR